MHSVMAIREVPSHIAKCPIQLCQSGVISFVAPSKLPVPQSVQGMPELTHEANINISVVLVLCPLNLVKLPYDQPFVSIRWLKIVSSQKKSSLRLDVLGP